LKETLLRIRGLKTYFFTSSGVVNAVDGVDLDIGKGETVGLVGESGSGKTVTALSIMRLIPQPPGRIVHGEVLLEGDDLLKKTEHEMRKIRGDRVAMSFQDPMTYLNPVIRVGDQIAEAIMLHQQVSRSEAVKKAVDAMEMVQIPSAADRAREYPHQLSGGMRQRILIAIAICCNPDLLIADEPTTALDVITQDQILELMRDLKNRIGSSLLLITHDLGIVGELADYVAVMYAGNLLEYGDVNTILRRPRHPYTSGLLESTPRIDWGKRRLKMIPGTIPDMVHPPAGCRFHPRCAQAKASCVSEQPKLIEIEAGHMVACHTTK